VPFDQLLEQVTASGGKRDDEPALVEQVRLADDETGPLGAVDKLHGAVMAQQQALGDVGDGNSLGTRLPTRRRRESREAGNES
jgi:hypothetical protein